jgi:hypothetical protein
MTDTDNARWSRTEIHSYFAEDRQGQDAGVHVVLTTNSVWQMALPSNSLVGGRNKRNS